MILVAISFVWSIDLETCYSHCFYNLISRLFWDREQIGLQKTGMIHFEIASILFVVDCHDKYLDILNEVCLLLWLLLVSENYCHYIRCVSNVIIVSCFNRPINMMIWSCIDWNLENQCHQVYIYVAVSQHKKATIHQVTTIPVTSEKSYFQVITTCKPSVLMTWHFDCPGTRDTRHLMSLLRPSVTKQHKLNFMPLLSKLGTELPCLSVCSSRVAFKKSFPGWFNLLNCTCTLTG